MIRLVRPTIGLKSKALAYRQAHFDAGEKVINGSELFDSTIDYEDWLLSVTNNSCPETVNPSWVLTDTFFALDDETQDIIGMISLRHTLNDYLKDFGHCGYSVKPSERKKGHATAMLKEIMKIAKKSGMKTIQLSTECSNVPSVKIIMKNGGIYVRDFEFEGEPATVYKISL